MNFRLLLTLFVYILAPDNNQVFSQRIYLSGTGPENAVPWEFKISTGRNSGYWTEIPVPSNWEMHGFGYYTYGEDHPGYESNPEKGFYKHAFTLPPVGKKRIFITFMGSMTDTYVKVNGNGAGKIHQGGFMQFSYEITDLVRTGNNLLEVEVQKSSSNKNIQKAERIADFWLFGGIFRPVFIDILPPEFIKRVAIDAQMDGSFLMDIFADNIMDANNISVNIIDNNGNQVGQTVRASISPGDSVIRIGSNFTDVLLWSHEFPNLHEASISLRKNDEVIHEYRQKFGFRTFEIRDHDGFYLNGKRILLKGANMHSFRPGSGRTLSRKDMEENFRLMREMNVNAVRPCHYPPDTYFFELCDSLGMLAIGELTGWTNPLNKIQGSRLVKEMIVRDVNHPCIVLWSNGNHKSHNPSLEEDFYKWDIQNRRPLKNFAKSEDYPGDYSPDFDMVDTRFYPDYDQLFRRLSGSRIVMPNETLHALYDGGGAAGLYDYWKAIQSSGVGGGLFIWAFMDEGLIRTDQTNRIDVQGNKAPDGVVGPEGQKEGSYYAAREIWSPVRFSLPGAGNEFNGNILLQNNFDFVNLNQCKIAWEVINFRKKNEAMSGYRLIDYGVSLPLNIPPGKQEILEIELPPDWKDYDAIKFIAYDHRAMEVTSEVFPIAGRKKLSSDFTGGGNGQVIRDQENPWIFHTGKLSLQFDEHQGTLKRIIKNQKNIPVGNFPFIAAESTNGKHPITTAEGRIIVEKKDDSFVIKCDSCNSFESFTWKISPGGELDLEYAFRLPEGEYYYAGIGMEVDADEVTGKRWLGNGPYRIWKNRRTGGTLNVWDVEKRISIPGEKWNFPEFEGFFHPLYWIDLRFGNYLSMGISLPDKDLALGILTPKNGKDPMFAKWYYPQKEGIYFFNCISAVGEKWKPSDRLGPQSQPEPLSGLNEGHLKLHIK